MILFLLLLFIPTKGFASIDIAFIELRDHQGQLIQLEPNGQFAHIAISYQSAWLHSSPFHGVEVISRDTLEKIGAVKAVITVSRQDSLNRRQIEKYLGKPYDSDFTWSDEKIYCSELVAKLLDIEPQHMTFQTGLWPKRFQALKGQLGLSPDDLFHFLKQRGYQEQSIRVQCSKVFQ